jgi:hypothetical protein
LGPTYLIHGLEARSEDVQPLAGCLQRPDSDRVSPRPGQERSGLESRSPTAGPSRRQPTRPSAAPDAGTGLGTEASVSPGSPR